MGGSERCRRCGRGLGESDEEHCRACVDEAQFWADVFREAADE